MKNVLDERTINLGDFLIRQKELVCKELTFMPGGSKVLDYMFLKAIAEKYKCKNYLEIGTYIGESLNVLTDCCEKLYSVTAPPDAEYAMDSFCRQFNLPNYNERLVYSDKIRIFYADSKRFDYKQIEDEIDLYFIDGDHSYQGVYADTQNVFRVKKDNAIVIWHDFRDEMFRYAMEVVHAVKDAIGDKFENVYVTDRNLCGIYLPDSIKGDFTLKKLKYEKNTELYTYDVALNNCQIK